MGNNKSGDLFVLALIVGFLCPPLLIIVAVVMLFSPGYSAKRSATADDSTPAPRTFALMALATGVVAAAALVVCWYSVVFIIDMPETYHQVCGWLMVVVTLVAAIVNGVLCCLLIRDALNAREQPANR